MAQTTAFFGGACGTIEVSANNSDWTDISGSSNSCIPDEQVVASGETHTLVGANPIVTGGKPGPIGLTFSIIYNDTSGEAFDTFDDIFDECNTIYVRWSQTGTAGDPLLTTGKSVIVGRTLPKTDALDGAPILAGFKVKAPSVSIGEVSA